MDKTIIPQDMQAADSDDELEIMECLDDYHRILVSAARKTADRNRRLIALNRAQMVKRLIDRLRELDEVEH